MTRSRILKLFVVPLLAANLVAPVDADDPANAGSSSVAVSGSSNDTIGLSFPALAESGNQRESHPLMPLLELAREGHRRLLNDVRDYTCVMIKRELVDGHLYGPERIFTKVRHEQIKDDQVVTPLSIYMKFQGPKSMRNREVLYVRNRADDTILVRKGGSRLAFLTFSLAPKSPLAMVGNRYPITEFGIKRMIERLIMFGERELAYEECEVIMREDVKVNDRSCICVDVIHPVERPHFQCHVAKIYIDTLWRVPVRFEAYDWPADEHHEPELFEEYTYRDLKLNIGLTDEDFQRGNAAYKFR